MSVVHWRLACLLAVTAAAQQPDPTGGPGVCCRDLGCYEPGGDFFNILFRPLVSVPECSLIDSLPLQLNTRRNRDVSQTLNPYDVATIRRSNFDPKKPTKVLMHGFLDMYRLPPWKSAMENLLTAGDYNVIRVDWSLWNKPLYIQACSNLRLVGAYLAKFLHVIVSQMNANPKTIHLIGHSLGAHGCGYAGALMQSKHNITIGRITGLDPAGPYFTEMPPSVRLDPTDAAFVDTIVTNGDLADSFGSPQAMGDMNFYPNGGLNQPGCSQTIAAMILNALGIPSLQLDAVHGPAHVSLNPNTVSLAGVSQAHLTSFDKLGILYLKEMEAKEAAAGPRPPGHIPPSSFMPVPELFRPDSLDIVGCSHNRAVLYFADAALNSTCEMTGYRCDNYENFLENQGGCDQCHNGTTCSRMGLYAKPALAVKGQIVRYYTATRATAPYCSTFKVEFKLQDPSPSEPDNDETVGAIYLTLYGTLGRTKKILVSRPEFIPLVPGRSYSFYPELPKEIGQLTSMTLNWQKKSLFGVFARRDYIFLDGSIYATDQNGVVSAFLPARSKVESIKDLTAKFVQQHDG